MNSLAGVAEPKIERQPREHIEAAPGSGNQDALCLFEFMEECDLHSIGVLTPLHGIWPRLASFFAIGFELFHGCSAPLWWKFAGSTHQPSGERESVVPRAAVGEACRHTDGRITLDLAEDARNIGRTKSHKDCTYSPKDVPLSP